ncbi:nitroreductase [Caulobacter sp. S45]|uniref:nitroreductase family protein n=1 Tax=Caulobacter sp. S45 TaxID=1641861 RepID=UPI0020C5F473|nr:nitroreductase [Caulobacter sp. S45]
MAKRRSASAQTLQAPGPGAAELDDLLRLAARVPDHGKMTPWRFIVMEGSAKTGLVERLRDLAATQANPGKAMAALGKMSAPPVAVAVVSTPREGGQPVWEQQMSAGAVCMNLLLAAEAMGYGANWITDWYSYDPAARALMGVRAGEQVAGVVYLGTPGEDPLERVRPDMALLVSRL